jgi:hypothetical protein
MKTTFDNVLNAVAVVMTACVAAISGYLFFANVGERWVYGVAIATMIGGWFARRFASSSRNVTASLIMAGALLLVVLCAKALEHMGWAGISDIALRMNGIMTGAVVVVISNAIPKRMGSANTLAMLRIAGTAFVLGGLGYSFAWLLLPLHFAGNVAMIFVLASLLVAVASFVGWYRGGDQSVS